MISLYFNCRITGKPLTSNDNDSNYFYPIIYPNENVEVISQYRVLISTIKSYSEIDFELAIFNIDIDNITKNQEYEIRRLIDLNIEAKKIYLNFFRPTTLSEWKKDAEFLQKIIEKDSPVLVVMNHDHPFVDYTSAAFLSVIDSIFKEGNSNFGKVMYYSHIPEVTSWAMNGQCGLKFIEFEKAIFRSDKKSNIIYSIGVMTPETISYIWNSNYSSKGYVGRFDWVDAHYHKMKIKFYLYPREFFKHFDGYGHVTGIRGVSSIADQSRPYNIPLVDSINKTIDNYYQLFLNVFILSIRDSLDKNTSLNKSFRNIFTDAVERSLNLFRCSYLEKDSDLGLISRDLLDIVFNGVREKTYFNGNKIISEIIVDIKIQKKNWKYKLKLFINNIFD